jgi:hypothetical protein
MNAHSSLEILILNATSDDFENLEQIYRSVCLEFSPEHYDPNNSKSFYWRESANAPSLAELAEAVKKLALEGVLEAKTEAGKPANLKGDSSIIWQAWFHAKKRL